MGFDGAGADEEAFGDLGAGAALGRQVKHFAFAIAEPTIHPVGQAIVDLSGADLRRRVVAAAGVAEDKPGFFARLFRRSA